MIGTNPNPFVQEKKKTSLLRCLELIFGALFLLPIRLLAIAAGIMCCYLFARIGLSKRGQKADEPIRGWRRVIAVNGISFTTRITMIVCGFCCIRIKGPPPAPAYEAPMYIAAPKTSLLDELIPLLLKVSPSNRHNVKDRAILGVISRAMMSVFYKEKFYDSDMMDEVKTRAEVAGWLPIMLFPEEVYTNGESLIHFPTDLFQVMRPVQPVLISYSNRTHNNTILQSLTVCKLLAMLCTFKHSLKIQYLDVIYPDTDEDSETEFPVRVRDQLATVGGINTSEHSKEDVQMMNYARDQGLPPFSGIVEFMALKKKFDNLTLATAVKELTQFSQIDRGNKGVITQADLAHFFKTSPNEIASLFKKYNLDSNGDVTFQSFLEEHLQQANAPLSPPEEARRDKFTGNTRSRNLVLRRKSTTDYDNGYF